MSSWKAAAVSTFAALWPERAALAATQPRLQRDASHSMLMCVTFMIKKGASAGKADMHNSKWASACLCPTLVTSTGHRVSYCGC